jgi:hypothetical protein
MINWIKNNSINLDSKIVKSLILWFGLYQTGHILSNIRAAIQLYSGGFVDLFPALPPPNGWTPQAMNFFTAMATLDSLNALITIIFAIGYFRKAHWREWLGTLNLTLSLYAALVFNYATFASGAWAGSNLAGYLIINILYIPVLLLFFLFIAWNISEKRMNKQNNTR